MPSATPSLPGVVLAYIAGVPLLVGAFGAGMACALVTGFLAGNSRVKQDTVMGVVFAGMFGLGLLLYTSIETDVHLDHILFGNMLGVGPEDLLVSGAISAGVTGALLLTWKDLLLHAFDPAQARASGLRVGLLHYGLPDRARADHRGHADRHRPHPRRGPADRAGSHRLP